MTVMFLRAAIEGGAETIITFNRTDFPNEILPPLGLIIEDPDVFICHLYEAGPEAIVSVVDAARLNPSQATPAPAEFLEALERQRLRRFCVLLSRRYSAE